MKAQVLLLSCFLACLAQAQTTPSPRPPLTAPKDAKLFNWKWYAVIYEKVPWHTARDKCQRMGGQLVVIPDAPTWDFVKGLSKSRVWLGATDEKIEGEWVWVDGTQMRFTAWLPGKPNNYAGKDHYLTTTPLKNNGWEDMPKEWDAWKEANIVGYVCEWPAR
jgi:hypothetical protein